MFFIMLLCLCSIVRGQTSPDFLPSDSIIREGVESIKSKIESSMDVTKAFFKIYPNPSSEYVTLQILSSLSILTVDLYNVTGVKIPASYTISINKATIYVSKLLPGCYISRVTHTRGVLSLPLIVKH